MNSKAPPVPAENLSPKGPGEPDHGAGQMSSGSGARHVPQNLAEQGRQGNIKQNTTHQGYQQDR